MPIELESAIETLPAETHTAPPPPLQMIRMIYGKHVSFGISAVARLGIADHLGSEPIPVEQLARKVGAHTASLYRVMRMLASVGVFTEHSNKRFGQNELSETLRSEAPGSVRNAAIMSGDEWAARGMEHITHCVQTGCDGISKAFGKNAFEFFKEHPEQGQTFHRAMTDFSIVAGEQVADAYDFSEIHRLADVGGGHGLLLASILKRNEQLRGVVYDLPEVVAGAVTQPHVREYAERLEFEEGSFLESVPSGCDAFIMKHIIHDWSDEACIQILRNMKKKLPENGRVLLCELVVPDQVGPDFSKLLDIEMLVYTPGGKERTEPEFATLFAAAGFRLERIVRTEGPLSIIEARPV